MRQFLYIFLQLHNFIIRLFVVFVQLVTTPVHTIFQLLKSARPGDKLGFPCFMTQRNIKIDM